MNGEHGSFNAGKSTHIRTSTQLPVAADFSTHIEQRAVSSLFQTAIGTETVDKYLSYFTVLIVL